MAQPYVGEIRQFAGNFNPLGWEFCNGQLLPIAENETLFQLIGTTYGGDGQENFALPDLRSRVPMHFGNSPGGITRQLAEASGVEEVTLTIQQIPVHNHVMLASSEPAGQTSPSNEVLGTGGTISLFRAPSPNATMNAAMLTPTGGSQPHTNVQPYLCLNFIISLFGIFPSQT